MTQEEAKARLNYTSGDDLEELFEQHLFEFKQYFVYKPVISRLFNAQLDKLKGASEAANVLGLYFPIAVEEELNGTTYPENIERAFLLYEKRRSELRIQMMQGVSPNELVQKVQILLAEQQAYFKCWPLVEVDEINQIVLANEPDPMDLLKEIKTMSIRGIQNFSDLSFEENGTCVTFWNEMKRVSLLRQKEKEWKMSLKN